MTAAVATEGLTFRYAGRKRPCLQDVSCEIAPGETVLILGPSGCGKSTFAQCLNGLIPHVIEGEWSGAVRIDGRDTRDCPLARTTRDVGMLFQDPDTQFCMLRVDDEIAFGLENLSVARTAMDGRIAAALRQAGLHCCPSTRIETLSGGNKQRLALACVLAMEPRILVIDEPTSHLDPWSAQHVATMLAQLKARGEHTVILIEHRLDHLMDLVDRIVLFGPEGRILADGAPRRVLQDQAAALDRLGIWIPQVSELARTLQERGVTVDPYPLTMAEAATAFRPLVVGSKQGCDGGGGPDLDYGPTMAATAGPGGAPGPKDRTAVPGDGYGRSLAILQDRSLVSGAVDRSRGHASFAEHGLLPPAVAIDSLSYRYDHGPEVLHDIHLNITKGDFVAIVGPNGAGKSTLAQHIAGILRPPRGTLFLGERDIRDLPTASIAAYTGYVFQNPEHQFVTGSVFDELAFGLRLRKLPEPTIQQRVESMLADFGLLQLQAANPFRLSHGEKRRLSVATMLILGQELLVLDEPTIGQDRRNALLLLSICERLHQAEKTIVMITHDMRLVAEHARTVVVLVEGQVAFSGSPSELFADRSLLARAQLQPPPMLELSRELFGGPDTTPARSLPCTADALAGTLLPAMTGAGR